MEMINRFKNKKRGFTLIELIVVIAILGILAAILVPSMLNVVDNSKKGVNVANARSIYTIAQSTYTSQSIADKAPTGKTFTFTNGAAPSESLAADTDFVTTIKNSLDAGLNKTFTVTVGTSGVTGVTYGDSSKNLGVYPESFAS